MAQAVSHHSFPLQARFSCRPNSNCIGITGIETGGVQWLQL